MFPELVWFHPQLSESWVKAQISDSEIKYPCSRRYKTSSLSVIDPDWRRSWWCHRKKKLVVSLISDKVTQRRRRNIIIFTSGGKQTTEEINKCLMLFTLYHSELLQRTGHFIRYTCTPGSVCTVPNKVDITWAGNSRSWLTCTGGLCSHFSLSPPTFIQENRSQTEGSTWTGRQETGSRKQSVNSQWTKQNSIKNKGNSHLSLTPLPQQPLVLLFSWTGMTPRPWSKTQGLPW